MNVEMRPQIKSNLNPEFVFETFVEGKSNQLARAASVQIGENPGLVYNPLFIYGGVGLGKTHLMHAIGNSILKNNPSATVLYKHSEGFVAAMVRALQHNKIDEFKREYRSVNALLIDDVQFFAGKERSQEEFFHTFNALFESKQQIILTSDRFPKEVPGLEERLKSRFGWGLTVAIEPPDLETRVAIIKSKADQLFGVDFPNEVAFFIGNRVRSNIRELEGALITLLAQSTLNKKTITPELARNIIDKQIKQTKREITLDYIQKVVCDYFDMNVDVLQSKTRKREIVQARQIAMYFSKNLTSSSLSTIGSVIGGKDHATVLHAYKTVNNLAETNKEFKSYIVDIEKKLKVN
jgi:chromosomal replication initiator protein